MKISFWKLISYFKILWKPWPLRFWKHSTATSEPLSTKTLCSVEYIRSPSQLSKNFTSDAQIYKKQKRGIFYLHTYSNLVQNSHKGIFFVKSIFYVSYQIRIVVKLGKIFVCTPCTMISRNLSKWSSIVSTMRNLLSPKSFSVKSTNLVIYLVNASLSRNFCLRMHVEVSTKFLYHLRIISWNHFYSDTLY